MPRPSSRPDPLLKPCRGRAEPRSSVCELWMENLITHSQFFYAEMKKMKK